METTTKTPRQPARRRRWAIAIGLGLVVHVAALGFLRFPVPKPAAQKPEEARTHWVDPAAQSLALHDQYALLDSEPLFLPTRWNYPVKGPSGVDAPGDFFGVFDAERRLTIDREKRLPDLLPPPAAVATPMQALADYGLPVLKEFGREERQEPRRPEPRLAYVEIRALETGALMLTRILEPAAGPANGSGWGDWTPFEMMVNVTATGSTEPWLSTPAPAEIAHFFAERIRHQFHLDLLLPAGSYRVSIGP